jgi:hypothetical protein
MSDHLYTTIVCIGCGHEISVPVYCKDRFCPICSGPRSRRIRRKLNWYVHNSTLKPGQSFKHLVLTVRNDPDLSATVDLLVRSFRRLRQRAWWKRHVTGGAYVIEITGRPGNWHPHIHVLLQSWFMPYQKLKSLWEKCSGSWGVSIQERPPHAVANYLTDYITKAPKMEAFTRQMNLALGNRRLYSVFGSWHSMKPPDMKVAYRCTCCGCSCFLPESILDRQLNRYRDDKFR